MQKSLLILLKRENVSETNVVKNLKVHLRAAKRCFASLSMTLLEHTNIK